jgi:uncharacterized protein DUF6265
MWQILAAVLAGDARPVALPDWMAGCWEHRSQDRWTEECWTVPRGGIMLGNGRSGTGGVLDSWEVMQIELVETDDPVIDPLTFYGAPKGQNRTAFSWDRSSKAPGITFVNAGHDYPQRIRYWRDGKDLMAEVSLAGGSKAQRWRYAPKGDYAPALSARTVRPRSPTSAKPPVTAMRSGGPPCVR